MRASVRAMPRSISSFLMAAMIWPVPPDHLKDRFTETFRIEFGGVNSIFRYYLATELTGALDELECCPLISLGELKQWGSEVLSY
jgi:hypothetical protein